MKRVNKERLDDSLAVDEEHGKDPDLEKGEVQERRPFQRDASRRHTGVVDNVGLANVGPNGSNVSEHQSSNVSKSCQVTRREPRRRQTSRQGTSRR